METGCAHHATHTRWLRLHQVLLVTVMHETLKLKHLLHHLQFFLLLTPKAIRTVTPPHGLRLKREKGGNTVADGVTGGEDARALKGSVAATRTMQVSN